MDLADIMNVHTERRQDEDFRLKESTPTVQNANVRFQDCGQLRTAGSHERMLLTQHRAGTANRCTRDQGKHEPARNAMMMGPDICFDPTREFMHFI